ncbi:MAG: exopolysaccharide biosynthesis protein [Xanthobacteraceae bacterium]
MEMSSVQVDARKSGVKVRHTQKPSKVGETTGEVRFRAGRDVATIRLLNGEATKRLVGVVVVILNTTLVFTPLPLGNVLPALVIALISLAYLQEDGLLLSIALLAAVIVLAVEVAAVWEEILGAKWIIGRW